VTFRPERRSQSEPRQLTEGPGNNLFCRLS
jgi:hypothetical protein